MSESETADTRTVTAVLTEEEYERARKQKRRLGLTWSGYVKLADHTHLENSRGESD